jgi:hypothetical protein
VVVLLTMLCRPIVSIFQDLQHSTAFLTCLILLHDLVLMVGALCH